MKIRTLTETDAEAIATWRYPGRYQTYDVSEVVTSEAGFWAVEHEATLVISALSGQWFVNVRKPTAAPSMVATNGVEPAKRHPASLIGAPRRGTPYHAHRS